MEKAGQRNIHNIIQLCVIGHDFIQQDFDNAQRNTKIKKTKIALFHYWLAFLLLCFDFHDELYFAVSFFSVYTVFAVKVSMCKKKGILLLYSIYFIRIDSDFCLRYNYHMYSEPGALIVKAGSRDSNPVVVDSIYGNQGDQWLSKIVQIPFCSDCVVRINKMSIILIAAKLI